jgi:hypothetical protein
MRRKRKEDTDELYAYSTIGNVNAIQ